MDISLFELLSDVLVILCVFFAMDNISNSSTMVIVILMKTVWKTMVKSGLECMHGHLSVVVEIYHNTSFKWWQKQLKLLAYTFGGWLSTKPVVFTNQMQKGKRLLIDEELHGKVPLWEKLMSNDWENETRSNHIVLVMSPLHPKPWKKLIVETRKIRFEYSCSSVWIIIQLGSRHTVWSTSHMSTQHLLLIFDVQHQDI